MTFVAGAYSAVYNSLDLGLIEDGFTLNYRRMSERIQTDVTGDALQDGVYRGVELTLDFILSEWDAEGAQAAFWPVDGTLGELGTLGRLDTDMAEPLVLTSCGAASPTTLTFHQALLSPNFDVQHLFANRHRKIPLQMTVYPIVANQSSQLGQCVDMKLFTTA
jgi:hypothetical protein